MEAYPNPSMSDGQIDNSLNELTEQEIFELSMIPSGLLKDLADC